MKDKLALICCVM